MLSIFVSCSLHNIVRNLNNALDDVDSVWYVSISCTNDWPKKQYGVVHSDATARAPLPINAHGLSMYTYRLLKVFEEGLVSLFATYIQDGFSPVFVACQKGDTDVVDLLVTAGADIHLASKVCHLAF